MLRLLVRKQRFITISLLIAGVFLLMPPSINAQTTPAAASICTFELPVLDAATSTERRQGTCPPGYAAGSVIVAQNLSESSWTQMIYSALSGLGAFIAMLGGGLLDISISIFTVNMAETARSWGFESTINALWAVIRDLFNILFIFGLIWAGLQMVLGTNDAGSKRMIVSIVIAALLINFSLYATQVVIDFSNVAAHQIHSAIRPVEGTPNRTLLGLEMTSIADNFVNMANLDRLKANNQQLAQAGGFPTDGFIGSLLLGIVMLLFYGLLGFVFAAGAFILFSRFIALLFLMIFSPILFLGWILPGMKGMSDKWVKYLFSQALVGPAYLFMLYVALRAMQGMGEIREPTIMNMMVYILIVAAFLIAALKAAQSMSSWGGLQAYNAGSFLERRMRSTIGSAGGVAGRNTIGRAGNWAQNRFTSWQAKPEEQQSGFGKRMRGLVAGTNFDRAVINATDKAKNSGFGGTSFEASQKQQKERSQRLAKDGAIQKVSGAVTAGIAAEADQDRISAMERAVTGATNEQILELLKDSKPDSPEYKAVVANMSASQYEAAMKAKADELDESAKAKLTEQRKQAVLATLTKDGGDLTKNIKNASDAQLKVLGVAEVAKHAADLKQSQFDDIMKSKDYTETERNNIKKEREAQLEVNFKNDPVTFLSSRKDKEVAKLPAVILKNELAAPYLTAAQLKQILHEDTLTKADRGVIRTNIDSSGSTPSKNWLKTTEGRLF